MECKQQKYISDKNCKSHYLPPKHIHTLPQTFMFKFYNPMPGNIAGTLFPMTLKKIMITNCKKLEISAILVLLDFYIKICSKRLQVSDNLHTLLEDAKKSMKHMANFHKSTKCGVPHTDTMLFLFVSISRHFEKKTKLPVIKITENRLLFTGDF